MTLPIVLPVLLLVLAILLSLWQAEFTRRTEAERQCRLLAAAQPASIETRASLAVASAATQPVAQPLIHHATERFAHLELRP